MSSVRNAIIVETTLSLLVEFKTITSMGVEEIARKFYTDFIFDQEFVSNVLSNMAQNGMLLYSDNGTYRIYSLNVDAFVERPIVQEELDECIFVDYNRIVELMSYLIKDDRVRVTFKKKDGSTRILSGVVLEPNRGDGKVLFIDLDLDVSNNIRSVDIRRVTELIMDDIEYILT